MFLIISTCYIFSSLPCTFMIPTHTHTPRVYIHTIFRYISPCSVSADFAACLSYRHIHHARVHVYNSSYVRALSASRSETCKRDRAHVKRDLIFFCVHVSHAHERRVGVGEKKRCRARRENVPHDFVCGGESAHVGV